MPAAMGANGLVGPYHLAWEIDTIEGLAEMAKSLGELGVLTGASDHGVSKSLYGRDLARWGAG